MNKNIMRQQFSAVPIEKHETASWANIETTKPLSNVSVPSENEVGNAKDWVDSNEK